jgi:energy-coupling factor transporter ATP-binding protein EcfA2
MNRQIYLPELLSINIKNYTLYPNGMDYTYDFVKGINLILGGNGMGKTTFVNIIRYAIIGNYKRQYDYTRTYKEKSIEKRIQYPDKYYSSRMDSSILTDGDPTVRLSFKLNGTLFDVERGLKDITILKLKIDGEVINGDIVSQSKYEQLAIDEKESTLLYKYEVEVEKKSKLSFDDLIFFVNNVLFFGEDHKTILWNDDASSQDVQTELFNKYFNDPILDKQRQAAERQAKYYNSISRHRSEDMRAINNVLNGLNSQGNQPDSPLDLLKIKADIEVLDAKLDDIQDKRSLTEKKISVLQNDINRAGAEVSEIEREKARIEDMRISKMWEGLHYMYHIFEQNIRINHICPMCNREDNALSERVTASPNSCFVCEKNMDSKDDKGLNEAYQKVLEHSSKLYAVIANKKVEIQTLENDLKDLDTQFCKFDVEKRKKATSLRSLEYANSKDNSLNGDVQPFIAEINRLSLEKEKYQKLSEEEREKAASYSKQIEYVIKNNVKRFSELFSSYAEKYLGVPCQLTFDKSISGETLRFYPVIDGVTRYYEEELSESQRFFVDHSFRMSILSFFYTTPSFYIVETPDSSLDISYEQNAARVFMKFLDRPNSIILTSNLNNSSFVNYLIENMHGKVGLVGLPDIAKKSIIQSTNDRMLNIYNDIKNRIK